MRGLALLDVASALQHAVQVIVATGFIAKNQAGQVTTLKRNGSDYSATIMGALVRSSNIVIWTDVDGVFSADPRKVRPALPHPTSTRSSFLQLCSLLGEGVWLTRWSSAKQHARHQCYSKTWLSIFACHPAWSSAAIQAQMKG